MSYKNKILNAMFVWYALGVVFSLLHAGWWISSLLGVAAGLGMMCSARFLADDIHAQIKKSWIIRESSAEAAWRFCDECKAFHHPENPDCPIAKALKEVEKSSR